MQKKQQFTKLFSPVSIGPMTIRNRLVMPPMGTNYANDDGYVTQRLMDYYEERANGGAGLIIVEVTCIDAPVGKTIIRELAIDSDKYIPSLSKLAQTIQRHGARAVVQLHHGGRSSSMSFTKVQPVAPSAVPGPTGTIPRELTVSEIAEIVARFAAGAVRAKRAGFDGVEIHAATSYLISNFLSRAYNKRQDAYGGELRNRARLLLEIIDAIRQSVGKDYPVWPRLNCTEFGIEDGITIEEAAEVASMAHDASADAINVTAYPYPALIFPMAEPPGNLVYLAEEIKKVVSIPVIVVGRINPEVAETALQEGKADLVAMGRALIADPELPNKVASGRLDDITPCIGCEYCHDTMRDFGTEDGYVRCAVNARASKEREYKIKPAKKIKRVLIVGGGPAGMEAARVARLRGHEVTLYNKDPKLGGQLLLARVSLHKDLLDPFIRYLERQVIKLGTNVKLGTEVTPKLIEEIKPDVVILATGVIPLIPRIPGINRDNVVLAEEVLTGKAEVGERVVVIGGGLVGCEVAELLADKGKRVTIVEMLEDKDIRKGRVFGHLLNRLATNRVNILTGARCEELTDSGLTIMTREGERRTLPVNTIVVAAGGKSNRQLLQAVKKTVSEYYLAGDCKEPHGIPEAISDAYQIALQL